MSVAEPVIDYIDGQSRRIYLRQGVSEFHWIEDLYREYLNLRGTDEALHKWAPMLKASGNEPKGGGKYTPRFVTMLGGTRVIPYDENILITVTGEAITDNADVDPDPFDTSTRTQPLKLYITPPAAELVKAADELIAIQRMAFDEVISINIAEGVSGTDWPIGTLGNPVNNLADALAISAINDIFTFSVLTDTTVDSGGDYRSMTFIGASKTKTVITVSEEAMVNNCEFYDAHVKGILDGDSTLYGCVIDDLNYVTGFIEQCVLDAGTILLGSGATAHFLDCWSGVPGVGTPVIDMGGAGQALAMRNYNGGITIINKTGTESVSIDLNSGQVKLDLETVTNGTIVIRGIGKVINLDTGENIPTGYYGDLYILNETMSRDNIASAVFDAEITDHQEIDTAGHVFMQVAYGKEVFLDTSSPDSGTNYPIGTSTRPVNNLADALVLCQKYNCDTLHLHTDITVNNAEEISELTLKSHVQNVLVTLNDALAAGTRFLDLQLTGSLSGRAQFENCHVNNLSGMTGEVSNCQLQGDIYLGNISADETFMRQCSSIDLAGPNIHVGNETMIATGFSGRLTVMDFSSGLLGIGGDFCQVVLDSSCTGGMAAIGTKGHIVDNSQGTVVALSNALNTDAIAQAVMDYDGT